MNRLTDAQAVASGAASLILFSSTWFAGYALAANGNATPTPTPPGTATMHVASAASKAAPDRDEQRIRSLHDGLNLTPAQGRSGATLPS
jgi:hypothetical protein